MFASLFGKKDTPQSHKGPQTPTILGLRVGYSFEVDSLMLRLIEDELVVANVAPSHIIQAVGLVDMDGAWIYRFYTDDDAFLQVVTQGGQHNEHVVDVKLFHYYDTLDVGGDTQWNQLLSEQIGVPEYTLADNAYQRVWTSTGEYHNPVAMTETTWDKSGATSTTDQFTMLFERPLSDGTAESLFLSAEEAEEPNGQLSRCFVISTGITLTPSQITIHG